MKGSGMPGVWRRLGAVVERGRAVRPAAALLLLALSLAAGPAAALGLGQIQVRSQAGEPLLAEIPVVSTDPAELRELRARLASPETFARIGLEPPQGAVSDLQFNVALDASGRPVIRVTTLAPVRDPLLTFLLEVDWGQGRLVREYSALLDAPATVAAPAQPPIQAPRPAAAPGAGAIVREAAAGAAPDPAAVDAAAPGPASVDADAASAATAPVPPVPVAATSGRSTPGLYGPVQAGDTLSQIVQRIAPDDDVTVNQMMLALLRSNPEAFIGGNVNLLREGAVLRIPSRDEAVALGAREATAEIAAQVARWRELSQPAPQPEPAAIPLEGAAGAPDAAAPMATAARDARLEIVPPTAGGAQQAGTRSGIAAGGEGDMLRQELQQVQETLAARDAEVEELKARLDELERLQRQQQALIALKDGELAAAQQRLETSNREAAPAGGGGAMPWIGGGIAGLLLALAVAWLLRRRADRAPAFRAPPPSSAPVADPPAPAAPSPSASPTWHAAPGRAAADPITHGAAAAAPPARAGLAPSPAPVAAADEAPADASDAAAAAGERIELARAYVELGDPETARSLLREAIDGGSVPERAEAEALLRRLDAAPPR